MSVYQIFRDIAWKAIKLTARKVRFRDKNAQLYALTGLAMSERAEMAASVTVCCQIQMAPALYP